MSKDQFDEHADIPDLPDEDLELDLDDEDTEESKEEDEAEEETFAKSEEPSGELATPKMAGAVPEVEQAEQPAPEEKIQNQELNKPEEKEEEFKAQIFALRTTANREDQVMDFVVSNSKQKKLAVYTVIRPHGMRGYIFVEASDRQTAEQAAFNVPYARGILPKPIDYAEIEHMLEQVKREVDIRKNDIVEIIAGPFKREQAKVTRVDKSKEDVVVELLEAAVPIPMTLKLDAVKVVRRDSDEPAE